MLQEIILSTVFIIKNKTRSKITSANNEGMPG
jgi:hypothetical protein